MQDTRLLFGGDFVISDTVQSKINIDNLTLELFENSDFNFVNLEAPITSSRSKILKTGPNLKSHQNLSIQVLNDLNIKGVNLANNHILDYGAKGIEDTINICNKKNIETVGAGKNRISASKILYKEINAINFAFINFAENEWASATKYSSGANPLDIIENSKQIVEAKRNSEYVVVIVHGGHEYYNLPSPRMQKLYRHYVDSGADIIIGHHTHCISGFEIYKGSPIYYSLGNFLFTMDSKFSGWYTGLVLELIINEGQLKTKLHPVCFEKTTFALNLLQGEEKQKVLAKVDTFNDIITDEDALLKAWDDFIEKRYKGYLKYWSPISFISNKYIRGLLNKIGFTGISIKGIALKHNLMNCESHLDISKEVTKKFLENESRYTS